ncbi:MAG: TIGR00730 family Rossman fold protein [Endomicrobiales bacterium]|nr:TIGR00730 family Rossman fold protein [Endomicrobiales bacterium]
MAKKSKSKQKKEPQYLSKAMLYEQDPWRVLRIMSEFVEGFDKLCTTGTAVTIFGSARTTPDEKDYKEAEEIAYQLAKTGYTIITGGGPGIMEAANLGAKKAKGTSVGLNIQLPQEQIVNSYVNLPIGFRHFFVRKVMFLKYASAVIVMPGGFGTLDECFESLTLVQTEKIDPIPVILYGRKYWQGLLGWIEKTCIKRGMLSKEELKIFKVLDTPKQVVSEIKKRVKPTQTCKPNF